MIDKDKRIAELESENLALNKYVDELLAEPRALRLNRLELAAFNYVADYLAAAEWIAKYKVHMNVTRDSLGDFVVRCAVQYHDGTVELISWTVWRQDDGNWYGEY